MPSEAFGDDDGLNRFEAEWKAGREPILFAYLPRPDHPCALAIALRLIELDLSYRVQAGEDGPIAERYFQIPGFPLPEEQRQALRSREESRP